MSKMTDTEYEDHAVEGVSITERGWEMELSDRGCLWISREHGVEPHVGDTARLYGRGFGYAVRGLDLNGREVYYRTTEDDALGHAIRNRQSDIDRIRAYQREGRAKQDAQYDSLPPVFRRRIDGFRQRKRDFRWGPEAYELSCCVDAVKIAAWAGTPGRVKEFRSLDWDQKKAAIPDLFDGHSDNSFAFACLLAHHYLTDPALVEQEHGALCVLVGCDEYGCRYGKEAQR